MEAAEQKTSVDFGKWLAPALLAGVVGVAITLAAHLLGWVGHGEALHSYMFGFSFWMALTLGCFGVTLLHHAIRPSWGLAILRLMEAGGGVLNFALMALLFVPIAMFLPEIYEWAVPSIVAQDPVLMHKSLYLNPGFWLARAAIYFALWGIVAFWLRKSSLRQDRTGDPNEAARRINVSSVMLVFFVITMNFAWTDWFMSITPHWSSTMFGALNVVGAGLTALCLGTFIVAKNAKKEPYDEVVQYPLTRDLGNMCFAFTLLWVYFTLSQFLIIWSGNLPEFITYYVARRNQWLVYIGFLSIACQWFIPFLVLLAPRTKKIPYYLALITIWMFAWRFIDHWYTVKPLFGGQNDLRNPNQLFQWTDITAIIGMGGLWFAAFCAQVKQAAILPKHDQRLQIALREAHEH